MLLKRKFVTAVTIVSLVLPSVTVLPAFAASDSAGGTTFFSGLVQFIAQKFGLDQAQVKTAVDEYHAQQKTQVQQKMKDREKTKLDQLVKDGKITSDQEEAIIAEQAALKQKYSPDKLKDQTPAERKTDFQNMQKEIEAWATSKGIDPTYVMPGLGHGGPMMRSKRGGAWRTASSVTPTPTQ